MEDRDTSGKPGIRLARSRNGADVRAGLQTGTASAILAPQSSILVKRLGIADYEATWRAMREFTARRDAATPDELWVLQHPPVYTVGVAGRVAHLPRVDNGVPVVATDRGGQITYHGPGQAVIYLLLDMRRCGLQVRPLVRLMECAVIELLAAHGVAACGRVDAPGVYVGADKIAALGLRIKNACCYHGLALNIDMDLSPFLAIDPCGYPGLGVTRTADIGITDNAASLTKELVTILLASLQQRLRRTDTV